jgi:phospholipase/lecithinase/hemolysin
MSHFRKRFALLITLAVLCLGGTAAADSIAYGFTSSDTGLQVGMSASYASNGAKTIVRASSANTSRFVGIVSKQDGTSSTEDGTYVVESGTASAYVTTLNGPVHDGDYLSISPIKGMLMVTPTTGSIKSVGTALANQDTSHATSQTVTLSDGSRKTVQISAVSISINNQAVTAPQQQSTFLSDIGKTVVGKNVSIVRVVGALLLLVSLLLIEGITVASAIVATIRSIGRNPLAKEVIYDGLIRTMVIAAVLLISGLGAVFLVLWL